ncbi:MAG: glutathione S-transferase family protein [Alphaproteobacteria bacterium]
MTTPVLYQFHFSHFNERGRWACDYKGLTVEPRVLIPGLHIPVTRKLTKGASTSTPILVVNDDEVIAGSDSILHWLEKQFPEKPLTYEDPALATEVEEVTALFEGLVGAPFRRAYFDYVLKTYPGLLTRMFTLDRGPATKLGMRIAEPAMNLLLRAADNITPETVAEGYANMDTALDEVMVRNADTGYLVGDRFTKADLTAASLLCGTCWPRSLSFTIPDEARTVFEDWSSRWADHPGTAWVRSICDRYRTA